MNDYLGLVVGNNWSSPMLACGPSFGPGFVLLIYGGLGTLALGTLSALANFALLFSINASPSFKKGHGLFLAAYLLPGFIALCGGNEHLGSALLLFFLSSIFAMVHCFFLIVAYRKARRAVPAANELS